MIALADDFELSHEQMERLHRCNCAHCEEGDGICPMAVQALIIEILGDQVEDLLRPIVEISRWIDGHPANAATDPVAQTWARLAKVCEESGEVISAWIGVLGQNPRKGVTHSREDVVLELLDTAATALTAVEHMTGNEGASMSLLEGHLNFLHRRAQDAMEANR